MDAAVHDYVEAIPAERRPLFDRIHKIVLELHPDVTVTLSYQLPTYILGDCRLYIGAWKHGLSFYGWQRGRDAGFSTRHPELVTSKGTIKLTPAAAAGIPDDEFRDLFRAALDC
jgi:hypothetical protein